MRKRSDRTEAAQAPVDTTLDALLPGQPSEPGAEGSAAEAAPGADTWHVEELVLRQPPSTVKAGEINEALDVAPPSRRSMLLTRALVGAIVLTGGFAAGTWWTQHSSSTASASGSARAGFGSGAFPTGFPTGGFGGFPGGQGGAGGSGAASSTGSSPAASAGPTVSGTVKLVDGAVVYVAKPDGSVVRVTTGAKTTVSSQKPGKLSDLAAGDTVTVTGSASGDGSLTATTITERAR